MQRVYFLSAEARNEFFESVKSSGNFSSWTAMAGFLSKRRTQLDCYRSGELTLPEQLFDRLCSFLPEDLQLRRRPNVKLLDPHWGRKKGGFATHSKRPEIFERGRAILGKLKPLKYNFDLNMPLTPELCEFVGALIGDGFTNVYNNKSYLTGFAGHSKLDREYYDTVIIPIAKKLFGIEAYLREKGNGLWANFASKQLFLLLTKRFGVPAGVKFDTVLIPNEILSADKKLVSCCLRGIFDTDGCVFFDKRKTYRAPYIRAELHMCNEKIIAQISNCLRVLDIPAKMLRNKHRIQIIGKKAVREYLEKVGFSNSKHRKRIAEFAPEMERITSKLGRVS